MSDRFPNSTADTIKPLADALFKVISEYQNHSGADIARTIAEVLGCVSILDCAKTGQDYVPDAIALLNYMNVTKAVWMTLTTGDE